MCWRRIVVLLAAVITCMAMAAPGDGATTQSPPRHPSAEYRYGSAAFTLFVTDSYREAPSQDVTSFHDWFEGAYGASQARLDGAPRLTDALVLRAQAIGVARDPAGRAREELATAVWLYRLVKTVIPRFSLARGYEFVNTVRYGERQCLLQSVLIASLLQPLGVDAGVHMVWKNMQGRESNNGHAVTVVRLANGRDVEIDASEHQPVATHRGLFALDRRTGHYLFLEPQFDGEGFITAYRLAAGGRMLGIRDVQPLDVSFLRSQFYYYRGEQAPGGLVNGPVTTDGLQAAAHHLEVAQRLDPQNPLAVYMLGRVYLRLGRGGAAKAQLAKGYHLYVKFGHVPEGPRTAYASTGRM